MRCRHFLAAVLMLLSFAGCATRPMSGAAAAPMRALDPVSSPDWTQDVARFAAEDAATTPPAHPIVFTGSSSVRLWTTLAEDFPDEPLLNRGFGGSQLRDAVWYADDIVVRYQPRRIVLYAGDNDIDAGRTPEQVLTDFRAFVARVRRDLPHVPIVYLSIKPSLARIDQLPRQQAVNALLKSEAARMQGVEFVDVATPMLDAAGAPRPELFVEDGLHMTPQGYALWTRIVAPHLHATAE